MVQQHYRCLSTQNPLMTRSVESDPVQKKAESRTHLISGILH